MPNHFCGKTFVVRYGAGIEVQWKGRVQCENPNPGHEKHWAWLGHEELELTEEMYA